MPVSPGNTGHSFVVPAYGAPTHLRECLESLQAQTRRSPIVLATSTPSGALRGLAEEFGVRLVEHGPNQGIGNDWNFALGQAATEWVTIAHQDDVYLPRFVEVSMAAADAVPEAALVFTSYRELGGQQPRPVSPVLMVKRLLLEFGFLGRKSISAPNAKQRALRFGCPIPCPSVTLRMPVPPFRFREDMKVNLDWDAWLRLADGAGAFVYCREPLLLHRIHGDSETSAGIRDGVRASEDLQMFSALWPAPVARALADAYALSYPKDS